MSAERLSALLLAAYVAGWFLSFGRIYNERSAVDCGPQPAVFEVAWSSCDFNRRHAELPAVSLSFIWPAYWLGRGSIYITK